MDLESVILSEINQKDKCHDFTYTWNLRNKTMNKEKRGPKKKDS